LNGSDYGQKIFNSNSKNKIIKLKLKNKLNSDVSINVACS
jgi:hypothetical protein